MAPKKGLKKKRNPDEAPTQSWTDKDKEILRQLLRQHGSKILNDTKTMKAHLPTRYVFLKNYLALMGRPFANFASDNVEESENVTRAPIEEWIYALNGYRGAYYCSHANLVSKALQNIVVFEKQPESNATNGINYAEIYEYLASLMLGEIPKELSPANAKRVLGLLKELTPCIKDKLPAAQETLAKVNRPSPKPESFGDSHLERKRKADLTPEQLNGLEAERAQDVGKISSLIYENSAFNPFKIPLAQ